MQSHKVWLQTGGSSCRPDARFRSVCLSSSEMIRPTPESSKKAKKRSNFSVSLSSRVKEGNKMTLDVVKYDMAKESPEQRYFTKWGTFSVKCLFLLTKKRLLLT